MEKSIRTYFRRENKNALRHVTFLLHAALAEKHSALAGKHSALAGKN
jgi:hypothetical protein